MDKNILIISSDYNQFFIKPILFHLKNHFKNLEVYISEEKKIKKIKRYFYMLLMFNFYELSKVLIRLIKFFNSKKKYDYDHKLVRDINDKQFIDEINNKKFDLIVFFNCAQILKKDAIERLLSDTLNFHPGILSQHRGLFPIFYAMLKKEKFIGFTLHRVERKIDSGKIFNEIKLPIEEKDGFFSLHQKLYSNNDVLDFIKTSIEDYGNFKKEIEKKPQLSSYFSFPSFYQIIEYKILRFSKLFKKN